MTTIVQISVEEVTDTSRTNPQNGLAYSLLSEKEPTDVQLEALLQNALHDAKQKIPKNA